MTGGICAEHLIRAGIAVNNDGRSRREFYIACNCGIARCLAIAFDIHISLEKSCMKFALCINAISARAEVAIVVCIEVTVNSICIRAKPSLCSGFCRFAENSDLAGTTVANNMELVFGKGCAYTYIACWH